MGTVKILLFRFFEHILQNTDLKWRSNKNEDSIKNEDDSDKNEKFAAAIRANHPISHGLFYFEVTIIDKAKNGYIIKSEYIFFNNLICL